MKKNLFLGAGLVLAGWSAAMAQSSPSITPFHQFATDEILTAPNNGASRVTNYNDTIWFNSFDTPSDWTMTTNNPSSTGWVISNATGTNQGTWYFANTRINSQTGGNYAVLVPDDPSAAVMTDAKMTTTNAIDISAYTAQNLVLHYEYYAARFYDTLKVEVSGDGTNWTTLDKNDELGLLSTGGGSVSANPVSKELFIPASIVSSDSLYVRFFWDATSTQPGIGYGWFVDDVMVLDVLNNDLVLQESGWFDPVRVLYSWYFGAMPIKQAQADSMFLGATHTNYGKNSASNVQLTMDVTGPVSSSYSSGTTTTAAGATGDTLYTDGGGYFMPTTPGTYNVSWVIESSSTDDNPANNVRTVDFDVTNDIYSMAPYPISNANVIGKTGPLGTTANGGSYTLTQDYFFMDSDSIIEIGIAFDSEWSEPAAAFQLSLLDANGVAVAQSAITPVTAALITDDIIFFPMQTPTAISAGAYEAQLEYFGGSGDSLFVVVCQDPAAPNEPTAGGFFSRTTISYGGSNFIDDMAYIVLRTGSDCPSLNLSTSSVADANCGSADGSATVLVGGSACAACYFNWGDAAGTGLDSRNDLMAGTYSVTVSNTSGCQDIVEVTIANANAPVVTAVNVNDVACFGDADGDITLTMDASSGTAPFTYDWSNGSQTANPTLTGIAGGTYAVTITDQSGCETFENSIVVTEPSSAVSATAAGDDNGFGSASVSASGGTSPYTYLWSTGETTSSISNSNGGNLTVTVTDANGCETTASATVTPVGTNDIKLASSLNVFPNPSAGNFNIRFEDLSGTYNVSIVSTIGQVLETRVVSVSGAHVESFENVSLTKGIYFVSVKSDEGSEATFRVVVK